ncbi:MAG: endo alpha-1,4 polygalactosaminidase [Planctomycetes bacterium]|nr:endo alpha-1,4 polygalactosaminidase [Planctomycetota bacterium]
MTTAKPPTRRFVAVATMLTGAIVVAAAMADESGRPSPSGTAASVPAASPFRPASFAYVLQADALAESRAEAVKKLQECGRDLIVLDASYSGGKDGAWTRDEVDAIRSGKLGRKVVAYLSIGEAEDYRSYWQSSWDADRDGKPDPAAPKFLGPENPEWKGNYRVRYWDKAWQALILETLDRIVARGFDGVYLDIVDAFETYERDGDKTIDDRVNPETGSTYRRDMVRWVIRLAERGRTASGPDFLVIPQNGDQLLADADYLKTVSGIGAEDLFTDGRRKQDAASVQYRVDLLSRATRAAKPVLEIEYSTSTTLQIWAAEQARKHNLILLVTDRDLKTLGTVPTVP